MQFHWPTVAKLTLLIPLIPLAALPSMTQPPSIQPPGSQPIQTLHVASRLVIVDVVVVDANGNPIQGLKRSDFNLTENGVPQKLSSFEEHTASNNSPVTPTPHLLPNTFAVQPPPPESVTKTIILIDDLHYPNYPLVRADIADFIKTVPPGNPICIIRVDWHGLHMVQDFTSDPQVLQQAVAGLRMPPHLPNPDPMHVQSIGLDSPQQRLSHFIAGVPGRISLAVVTDDGRPDMLVGQEFPEITTLINNLNRQPTTVLRLGRVTIYAIKAGGYIGGILQPLHTPDIVFGSSQNPGDPGLAVSPSGEIIDTTTPDIVFPTIPGMNGPLGSFLPDLPLMPAAEGGLLLNQDLVDIVAKAGGHTFFDGAAKALPQILALGSDYYTLSYVPTNPDWDGSYRNIAINVSGIPAAPRSQFGWTAYGQPQVDYRHGYYALNTPQPLPEPPVFRPQSSSPSIAAPPLPVTGSAFPPAPIPSLHPPSRSARPSTPPPGLVPTTPIDTAMAFGTLTPDQIKFTISATPSEEKETQKAGEPAPKDNFLTAAYRDAPYRNVLIHYWVDPKDLKFSKADGSYRDDLQFVAILYGDNGLVVNSISTKTHIQFPTSDLKQIMASGIVFDQDIAVPVKPDPNVSHFYAAPDCFFLRIGVNEPSTSHVGVIEIPVGSIKLPPSSAPIASAQPRTP